MWTEDRGSARGFGKLMGAVIAYITVALIVWLMSVGAFMAILYAYP